MFFQFCRLRNPLKNVGKSSSVPHHEADENALRTWYFDVSHFYFEIIYSQQQLVNKKFIQSAVYFSNETLTPMGVNFECCRGGLKLILTETDKQKHILNDITIITHTWRLEKHL